MRVAVVQHDIVWNDRDGELRAAGAADRRRRRRSGAELVVLTETFSTGFAVDDADLGEPEGGPSAQFLAAQAAEHGVWVCGTCPEVPADADGDASPVQQLRVRRAGRHDAPLPQDPPVRLRRRGQALPGR